MNIEKIEKKDIAILPTPLYKLENISQEYSANVYIKRDDMTGIGMGGNKLRKLEYLVQDALDNGYTILLTYGAIQTNHGMLTAAVAAKFGLKSILILKNYEGKDPKLTGNLVLDKLLGADINIVNISEEDKDREEEIIKDTTEKIVNDYESNGEKVYIIPTGGSSTLGTLGYIKAAKEIKIQSEELGLDFDYIVCGQGSKGTFAGLWLGNEYYKLGSKIIGINVMETDENIADEMADFINKVSEELGLAINCKSDDIHLSDQYYGQGYAQADENTIKTIEKLARSEGIFVDPTYTGKVFSAVLDMIDKETFERNSNILFIHTGGYPGIFSQAHVDYISSYYGI